MNSIELTTEIQKTFGFQPTREQLYAMETFSEFMFRCSSHTVMVLRGSAGTGKTSLAAAMVRTLLRLGQHVVLLAPTGRAAKVFSLNSGQPASTIHRRIYRQKKFSGTGMAFDLNENLSKNTLFIVDEASMIANNGYSAAEGLFGTGRLLDDLFQYVYSGDNCHLMLIGDRAQLPPVGEDESPALDARFLEGYGMEVFVCDMDEVLRQSKGSGILCNATMIRSLITHDELTELPKIRLADFPDIHIVPGDELIDQLNASYSRVGIDGTMVVTRSNKRANIYNQGIRNMILGREEELSGGDRVMIVRNNYHWTELMNAECRGQNCEAVASQGREQSGNAECPSFLANGDIAVVQRVKNVRELYGFRFTDVWLMFPDYDNFELQLTVLMDSLMSESPSLTSQQQEQLFQGVLEDYSDIPRKADRMRAVREDNYYNALQIKYAYAVTCHKAQGGQWEHIYLDQGYMTDEMLTPDYIHWLYTAFTRATDKLYLVNWPKTQVAQAK